jgi:hypothetical protein
MSIQEQIGKMPFSEQHDKWRNESAELLRNGFNMYNKMINAWLNACGESPEERSGVTVDAWFEWFSDFNMIMYNALPDPLNMTRHTRTTGSDSREALFNYWKKFLHASPSDPAFLQHGIDEFIERSIAWQKNYIKFHDAWIKCLEKVSDAYKSGGDSSQQARKAVKACMESCEEFMGLWRQYAQKQAEELFRFSKSLPDKTEGKEVTQKTIKKVNKDKYT